MVYSSFGMWKMLRVAGGRIIRNQEKGDFRGRNERTIQIGVGDMEGDAPPLSNECVTPPPHVVQAELFCALCWSKSSQNVIKKLKNNQANNKKPFFVMHKSLG